MGSAVHGSNTATRRDKFTFANSNGEQLAALLERPRDEARAYALFAHCFTCSKDIAAAARVTRALAAHGIATLRFDFTGLGNSEGDFANSNFSSNVSDLIAAANALRERFEAPTILIGHSLGGAAVLAAAESVEQAKAVVTIGAPADPGHVSHLFADAIENIEASGEAQVQLAGRTFTVRKQFLEDLAAQRLHKKIAQLRKALLVLHAPLDDTVSIDNAAAIFQAARHPKSFISLDSADHLLSRAEDSRYVAETIAAWASRYLPAAEQMSATHATALGEGEVVVRELDHRFTQSVQTTHHSLLADEPAAVGGADRGPSPYEYLLAGLGACTSMTLRMYATRKQLALNEVSVRLTHERIHAEDCADCETKEGRVDRIRRIVTLTGDLSPSERARLLEIADRCPVHRTLHGEIVIETEPG